MVVSLCFVSQFSVITNDDFVIVLVFLLVSRLFCVRMMRVFELCGLCPNLCFVYTYSGDTMVGTIDHTVGGR